LIDNDINLSNALKNQIKIQVQTVQ
jgi:hypothetical protein